MKLSFRILLLMYDIEEPGKIVLVRLNGATVAILSIYLSIYFYIKIISIYIDTEICNIYFYIYIYRNNFYIEIYIYI